MSGVISGDGRPVRVLFIEQFGVGGLIHYAHNLCQALAEKGVDVSLLTATDFELEGLPRSYRLLNRLPLWDFHATRTRGRTGLARRLEQVGKALRYLRAVWICLRTIWAEQPDIVHVTEIKFLPDILILYLHRRSCLIHTCHNVQRFSDRDESDLVQSGRLWTFAQSELYRRCDGVIFHARKNLEELRRVFDQQPKDWTIIPHGEYGFFSPSSPVPMSEARRELGLRDGPHVLFFGALRRYKGLDVLLDGVAHLRRAVPDARLVIAGAPGLDVQVGAFKEQARRLGIADAVTWHTEYIPYDRVHLYFYACDVVALPYRKVYDSGVLKIAQALGRPAVVTDVGGLAAAVADGRAGRIVEPESPESLGAALVDLIENPEQAEALASRGRELARTEFSWGAVAERTIQFYTQVLKTCAS